MGGLRVDPLEILTIIHAAGAMEPEPDKNRRLSMGWTCQTSSVHSLLNVVG